MYAITAKGIIDFSTLWGAGASISFIMAMILNAPEVILWPLSFIHNDLLGIMIVVWSDVNKWGATTAYWIGPILMMIAQFVEEPNDLPKSYGVFFILYLIVGGGVTAMQWLNSPVLYEWYEWKYPGALDKYFGDPKPSMEEQAE